MAEVAFIVPCRDKAPWVAETVRSVLAQTYSPMTIVLSDQGSEDDSFAIMEREARAYNGPNRVQVVKCPDTEYRGMPGYNAHLNWLHSAVRADLFIQSSADDLCHPQRAEKVVEAWRETGCDYIATRQSWVSDDLKTVIAKLYDDVGSAHVSLQVLVQRRFGGKVSSAWTPKLMNKYGPLHGVLCQDMILPFWAALEGGMYFIGEALQTYVLRSDDGNLGLEGLLRGAKTPEEEAMWKERLHYQMTANEVFMAKTIEALLKAGDERAELKAVFEDLTKSIIGEVCGWITERNFLTMHRVDLGAFPV